MERYESSSKAEGDKQSKRTRRGAGDTEKMRVRDRTGDSIEE